MVDLLKTLIAYGEENEPIAVVLMPKTPEGGLSKRVAALVEGGKPKVHSKRLVRQLPDFGGWLRGVIWSQVVRR